MTMQRNQPKLHGSTRTPQMLSYHIPPLQLLTEQNNFCIFPSLHLSLLFILKDAENPWCTSWSRFRIAAPALKCLKGARFLFPFLTPNDLLGLTVMSGFFRISEPVLAPVPKLGWKALMSRRGLQTRVLSAILTISIWLVWQTKQDFLFHWTIIFL